MEERTVTSTSVCVAGITGWAGREIARTVAENRDDAGLATGNNRWDVPVLGTVDEESRR